MSRNQRQLFTDIALFVTSVSVALFLYFSGIISDVVLFFDDFKWLGIFIAGVFFTSVFTTAPAIILLTIFAQTQDPLLVAILGGFGAMSGDYVLFRFMRDRVAEDFKYLFSLSKKQRLSAIFQTELFKFFVPFLGAFIIASPFPDEIGVAMLGFSNLNNKTFLAISFVLNTLGILAIVGVAKILAT